MKHVIFTLCIFLAIINTTGATVYEFEDHYVIFGESSVTIPEKTYEFPWEDGNPSVTFGGTLQLDPNLVYFYDVGEMAAHDSLYGFDSIGAKKVENIYTPSEYCGFQAEWQNGSIGTGCEYHEGMDELMLQIEEFTNKSPAYHSSTTGLGGSLNADYVEIIGQNDSDLAKKYNGTPLLYGKKIYTVQEAEEALSDGTKFHVGLTYK